MLFTIPSPPLYTYLRYVACVIDEYTRTLTCTKCTPREKLWNPSIAGHCISRHQLGVASGGLNILSDFSMFILPLPMIERLQMSSEKKFKVYGCFSMGLVACLASVARLVYSIKLLHIPNRSPEYLTTIFITGLWRYGTIPFLSCACQLMQFSSAEIAIGIIVGCLPSLPRFFKQFRPKGSANLNVTRARSSSGSSQKSWRKYLPWSGTAQTESEGTEVISQGPRITTLNFSPFATRMADEGFFERNIPSGSKSVRPECIQLQHAPISWFSNGERNKHRQHDDVEAIGRAL